MRAKDLRLPVLRMMLAVSAALPVFPLSRASGQTSPTTNVSSTPGLEGRVVEDVLIRGNKQVASSIIRNVIRTQPGQKYDPANVQDDYRRIFELKKFSNVEAQVEPTTSGGVVVVFVVTEQELIKKIIWQGNKRVDTPTLQNAADIRTGQAIDAFRIAMAKQAIAATYRDKNFPMAHVDVPMDPLTRNGELIFNVVEGPQVTVRNIRFLGVYQVSPDDLKKQIKTATWFPIFSAGKYDPELVEQDMGAIRQYYHDHGFFDAKVGRKLVYSPDQTELQIDFVIHEGPRYVVDSIAFSGNSKLSDAQLLKDLNLREGRYYDEEMVQRDTKQIVKAYSPFGFIYAAPGLAGLNDPAYMRISAQTITRLQPGHVKLLYKIDEGRSFRLGRIIVSGNDKSQEKLVLREFRNFAPGSLYDSGGVQDALERVRALPYFSNVTMTPIGSDPRYRDLLVAVTEQHTASFNVGAGISSYGGLMGNIVYQQSNFDISNIPADWREVLSDKSFTGAGQRLRISLSPGTLYNSAEIQFSEPWLFDQPYQFVEDAYLRQAFQDAANYIYTDQRIGDTVTFGKYLDYQNTVSLSLRGEQARIYSIQDPRFRAPEILDQAGAHLLTSVGVQYQRDTTNAGIVPYKGTQTTAGVEVFGALGGEYQFERFALGWSGYQTLYTDLLDRRTVLGVRLNAGSIVGRSVFFERFYAGDIGSVRGFTYRGISPRSGRGDDPVGGDFYYSGTAEVSFPIYQNTFRGVFFMDFGDVENDIRFGVTRVSVGPGIRFSLPFLGTVPLAFYLGFPIVKDRHDNTQLISFSLGGALGR